MHVGSRLLVLSGGMLLASCDVDLNSRSHPPAPLDSLTIDPALTADLPPGLERIAVSFGGVVSDAEFTAVAARYDIRVSRFSLRVAGMTGSHTAHSPRAVDRRLIEEVRASGTGLLTNALQSTDRRIDGLLEGYPAGAVWRDDRIVSQGQSLLATTENIDMALEHLERDRPYIHGFEAIGHSSQNR